MFEYGLRVLFAGCLVLIAGTTGFIDFDFAWKAAASVCALAFLVQRMEAHDMINEGLWGFYAVAEAFLIAMTLAASGKLDELGMICAAPLIYAAAKKGSSMPAMAPIASGCLFMAWSMFAKNGVPSSMFYVQAAGVLTLGLLAQPVGLTKEIAEPAIKTDTEMELLESREEGRKLRDKNRDLERKSRRSNLLMELEDARNAFSEGFFERVAQRMMKVTRVHSVGLYALAQFEDSMVVRGTAGHYGQILTDSSLAVDLAKAPGQIRHFAHKALSALRTEEDDRRFANVLLTDHGRIVGMVALAGEDQLVLDQAVADLEGIAGNLALWVNEFNKREMLRRRTRQSELLYELASLASGAGTPKDLATRVSGDLWEILDVDHVAIWRIEDEQASTLSSHGTPCELMPHMSFAEGAGLSGWLSTGAPELSLFDTKGDPRCPAEEAARQRVGSFFAAPILVDGRAFGYLTLATHRAGGLDVADLETMRLVTVEVARAISRIDASAEQNDGAMTPSEFQAFVRSREGGCLVSLEAMKKLQIEETYGRPALNHALRQYMTRIRAKLPSGGAICRRKDGGLVAYLPAISEPFARNWANEAAATASMIGLRTPDGSSRLPLAIRARVALMGARNNSEIEQDLAAS